MRGKPMKSRCPGFRTPRRASVVFMMLAVALAGAAQAQEEDGAQALAGADDTAGLAWPAADDATLDTMRGAFDFAPGLHLAIGVERAVYMNGELVSRTSSAVGDASFAGTANGAVGVGDLNGTIALIRQGAGNSGQFNQLAPGTAATLIQNSLNDRAIAVVTTIDAATNSLQLMRSLNLQAALKDAVTLPLPAGR